MLSKIAARFLNAVCVANCRFLNLPVCYLHVFLGCSALSSQGHRISPQSQSTWAPAVTLSSSRQKPISVWSSANPDAIWWGQDFWEQARLNNFRLSNYRFDVWEIYYCCVLPHFSSSFLSAIFDMPNGCLQHPLCGTRKIYPLPSFFHLHFICRRQAFRIVTCQNQTWRDQWKSNARKWGTARLQVHTLCK